MKNRTAIVLGLVLPLALLCPKSAMACDFCWGAVGIKEWMTTLSPGGGLASSKASVPMATLMVGYDKFFVNLSWSETKFYNDLSYPFGTLDHNQSTGNIGYLLTPELSIAIGKKRESDQWTGGTAHQNNQCNGNGTNTSTCFQEFFPLRYNTIGSSYNHTFADSAFSLGATVAYGKVRFQLPQNNGGSQNTGTLSGSSTYLSYELMAAYSLTLHTKINLGYRAEQYDQLIPINVVAVSQASQIVTLTQQKVKVSGLVAGLVFAF